MWSMTWSIQSSMWWSLVGVTGTSVKDAVKKKKTKSCGARTITCQFQVSDRLMTWQVAIPMTSMSWELPLAPMPTQPICTCWINIEQASMTYSCSMHYLHHSSPSYPASSPSSGSPCIRYVCLIVLTGFFWISTLCAQGHSTCWTPWSLPAWRWWWQWQWANTTTAWWWQQQPANTTTVHPPHHDHG